VAKKKQPEVKKDLPRFEVGWPVVILRPHLWSGCAGEVVSEKDGIHRVKINGKHDVFHSDVPGDQLEGEL
jgi:hypothetical protein